LRISFPNFSSRHQSFLPITRLSKAWDIGLLTISCFSLTRRRRVCRETSCHSRRKWMRLPDFARIPISRRTQASFMIVAQRVRCLCHYSANLQSKRLKRSHTSKELGRRESLRTTMMRVSAPLIRWASADALTLMKPLASQPRSSNPRQLRIT
jgi:hypothetical protein